MQNLVGNYYVVLLAIIIFMKTSNGLENGIREVGVGVILDMDSKVGMTTKVCILMAIEELYGPNRRTNFKTIVHPHFRDSKGNNLQAASAAIDLIRNTQVMALLGPQQSSQANFVTDIANTSKVPILSPATSPDLSSELNPYFIRIAQTSSTQAQPIAAIVKSFGWREVVLVYEDTDFGRGPIPYLFDAMKNIGTQVMYRTLLSPSSSDDTILQQLHKLKTVQTRVFVVHMLPDLASRFFKKTNEVGMMAQGYTWIISDVLTGLLHNLDPQDIDSMQGVLGVRPYIPPSYRLTNFERKWRRRFMKEYPKMDRFELDMFAIWSYDAIFALASAFDRVKTDLSITFKRPNSTSTDLDAIGTSKMGSMLLPMIQQTRRNGLSGDFHLINGQLQTSVYQIVNVIGKGDKQVGFWNSRNGLSNQLSNNQRSDYTTKKDDLGAIIWPGDTSKIPKGLEIPTSDDNILRVGVPANGGFIEFIEAYLDPKTNKTNTSGFCIDVFYAVIDALRPNVVPYKFMPYENPDGERSGNYNDLVYQIVLGNFDMVVGDVTILFNRSNYVDFTLPYSESGVSMLVPVKVDNSKNAWIFMKPLEKNLWITIGVFFIYTGFVVWVLEHRVNEEFRGPPHQQIGMIFWFSFSTLVFAQKEKMISNLSRFVVIVWVFVVLVLTSSYTASLSSMLTAQKLLPSITNIYELLARGDYVGYQDGSFVEDMLKGMGFPAEKLKKFSTFKDYAKALSDGSKNNGVSAIVDEVPYLKMLQDKNCNKFIMVGPTYKTAGFGFAFPKGSPMVDKFSRAILKVIEGQIGNISKKWIENIDDCSGQNDVEPFDKLTLSSFKGLFFIAGLSSTYALVVFLFTLLYENKEILVSQGSMHQKMIAIIRSFDEEKIKTTYETEPTETITVEDNQLCVEESTTNDPTTSPTISIDDHGEEISSPRSPN